MFVAGESILLTILYLVIGQALKVKPELRPFGKRKPSFFKTLHNSKFPIFRALLEKSNPCQIKLRSISKCLQALIKPELRPSEIAQALMSL